ncbi:MAG: PDZ domain-containing protein [bacterium]
MMKSKYRLTFGVVLTLLAFSMPVAGQLKDWGEPDDEGGWLGVSIQNLTTALKEAMDYDRDAGVLVNDVEEESPAQEAGIREGDVIIEYDGRPIRSTGSLIRKVRASDPGDEVKITVVRKGREKTLTATIGQAPKGVRSWYERERLRKPRDLEFRMEREQGWLGVQLQDLNDQLGDYFGVSDGEGALVTQVIENSPAEKAGLKAGDVIVSYDGDDIEDSEELVEAVRESEVGEKVEIKVLRNKRTRTFDVVLGETPEEFRDPRFEIFGPPYPEVDIDIRRFDDCLRRFKALERDWGDRMRGRLRVYGESTKDALRDLKKRLDRLEREMERLKERL